MKKYFNNVSRRSRTVLLIRSEYFFFQCFVTIQFEKKHYFLLVTFSKSCLHTAKDQMSSNLLTRKTCPCQSDIPKPCPLVLVS